MYELKGDELVNFPWNHDNIDEWAYRPVKFSGRQIHKHTMFPQTKRLDFPGAHYILPIVTKEDDELTHGSRQGILVNKGWIPKVNISTLIPSYFDYLHFLGIDNRLRIEDSTSKVEFIGYVSQGKEMQGGIFTNGANTFDEQRFNFTSFFLPEMVDAV